MKELNTIGDAIDLSEEEFKEFISDKNVGYLLSLKNLLLVTYSQVCDIKDDLVNKFKKHPSLLTEENKVTLNGIYHKLMAIEYKVIILNEFLDTRTLEN